MNKRIQVKNNERLEKENVKIIKQEMKENENTRLRGKARQGTKHRETLTHKQEHKEEEEEEYTRKENEKKRNITKQNKNRWRERLNE